MADRQFNSNSESSTLGLLESKSLSARIPFISRPSFYFYYAFGCLIVPEIVISILVVFLILKVFRDIHK